MLTCDAAPAGREYPEVLASEEDGPPNQPSFDPIAVPGSRTKEMMQPCLIFIHVISLVARLGPRTIRYAAQSCSRPPAARFRSRRCSPICGPRAEMNHKVKALPSPRRQRKYKAKGGVLAAAETQGKCDVLAAKAAETQGKGSVLPESRSGAMCRWHRRDRPKGRCLSRERHTVFCGQCWKGRQTHAMKGSALKHTMTL